MWMMNYFPLYYWYLPDDASQASRNSFVIFMEVILLLLLFRDPPVETVTVKDPPYYVYMQEKFPFRLYFNYSVGSPVQGAFSQEPRRHGTDSQDDAFPITKMLTTSNHGVICKAFLSIRIKCIFASTSYVQTTKSFSESLNSVARLI